MFEQLKAFHHIIVTGPQRSGTRICAKMVAADTGFKYLDEALLGVDGSPWPDSVAMAQHLLKEDNVVLHCPSLSYTVETLATPDTMVVFMIRNVADIIASQKRIDWMACEPHELAKYGRNTGVIAEVRYEFWKKQKEKIPFCIEQQYEELSQHPLWIPPEKRKDFKGNQTTL